MGTLAPLLSSLMKDGTEYKKGYYTPFMAEAFTSTVSELEALKVGRLKQIREVAPKFEAKTPKFEAKTTDT